MSATLSVRPNRLSAGSLFPLIPVRRLGPVHVRKLTDRIQPWRCVTVPSRRTLDARKLSTLVQAGSRADDSAPFEMSVENALKLLGVSDGDSFDDILRAKNAIVDACKDDQEAIAQVLFCTRLHWTVSIFGYFLYSLVSLGDFILCISIFVQFLFFVWLFFTWVFINFGFLKKFSWVLYAILG